jgi:uncharacterized membrane protein YjjP (DUF1212 family)
MTKGKVTEEVKKELLELQKKRKYALIMMVCYFPFGVFISKLLGGSIFAGILIFVYFIFVGILLMKVAFHKCPRCHKSFFSSPFWANGFTNKCLNCGINFKGEEE